MSKVANYQQPVKPTFGQNFQDIDWQHDDVEVIDTLIVKRTSTKRVYLYGPSADHGNGPFEFVPIPPGEPLPCPNPNCVNGSVDTGGVTLWGSSITNKCEICDGTSFGEPAIAWPSPTKEMLDSPEFEKIWQCIRHWDINVPGAYVGYMGATGCHVRAILDALKETK
jgi:hypothetical protein